MPVRYIPNQGEIRRSMLEEIGVKDIKDLFCGIPEDLLLNRPLDIPAALSETEVRRELDRLG